MPYRILVYAPQGVQPSIGYLAGKSYGVGQNSGLPKLAPRNAKTEEYMVYGSRATAVAETSFLKAREIRHEIEQF